MRGKRRYRMALIFCALVIGTIWGFFISAVLLAHDDFVDLKISAKQILLQGYKMNPVSYLLNQNFFSTNSKNESLNSFQMIDQIKILCLVLTKPKFHKKRAIHVKNTWGKRCTKLIFMSSENDTDLGSINLNVQEGRDFLWAKTKESFKLVYSQYFDEADWFFKTDDDTYVIVENLKYFLKDFEPSRPIYFGCKFIHRNEYMSGGAGYVLSKEALRRFAQEALPDTKKCRNDHGGAEDVEMGKCLMNVGVESGDSRDEYGRYRFLPFYPEHHLIPGFISKKFWYWDYIYYPQNQGKDCCSDQVISFHYILPNEMYVLDYLLYRVNVGLNVQKFISTNTSEILKIIGQNTTSKILNTSIT